MPKSLMRVVLCFACLTLLAGGVSGAAARQESPTWLSAMIWAPTLDEAGSALAEHVNQIDAACTVNLESVQSTNGATADGATYAFLVTWTCPASNPSPTGATWQSALIWQPTLQDSALAMVDLLNQIDAGCRVDVTDLQSANGPGPEGPVYAFAVTWAC